MKRQWFKSVDRLEKGICLHLSTVTTGKNKKVLCDTSQVRVWQDAHETHYYWGKI
jgi:hypothetical protein